MFQSSFLLQHKPNSKSFKRTVATASQLKSEREIMWVLLNLEMKQYSPTANCEAGNFPYLANGKNLTLKLWSSR